jgi:hypothetical protein
VVRKDLVTSKLAELAERTGRIRSKCPGDFVQVAARCDRMRACRLSTLT